MIKKLKQLSSFFGIKWQVFKTITKDISLEYKTFYITQKNGKKRKINSPSIRLYLIQRNINDLILKKHNKLYFVYGFYSEVSHIDNARYHLNSKEMLSIDLENFFGSINSKQVYFVFHKMFGFNKSVSTALTTLTTLDNQLPQGAPSSPMLSNLVFRNVDYRIEKLSEKLGIKYSRYADDLTFSSNDPFDKVYVLLKVSNILKTNGYKVNKRKTRMFSNHMIVNGLVIKDKKIKVQSYYIRKIKQDLYYIEKYGLEDHIRNKYKYPKDFSIYLEELYGKINYVKQINPDIGFDLIERFYAIINNFSYKK